MPAYGMTRAIDLRVVELLTARLCHDFISPVAAEGLPRGGRLVLNAGAFGPEITAAGQGAGPQPAVRTALTLAAPTSELTARTVGAHFAGLLADALGRRLVIEDQEGGFRLAAVAP